MVKVKSQVDGEWSNIIGTPSTTKKRGRIVRAVFPKASEFAEYHNARVWCLIDETVIYGRVIATSESWVIQAERWT